ncbi:T9SS type A sorting domain-containing protein [Flavobacterium franklandianum]|uniref:T9SS type A sorting domain-containing protein n=1 Tax=Flavobacterium franklandianum TaxID=2594430 RepID=UPI00117A1D21|nr:T9SS type A sorting domain-containing protein [Flavobacterium franklandianum]TRX27770.1 T9SS type A sorting domain-containing protein [Flavobacterium franklandianum]
MKYLLLLFSITFQGQVLHHQMLSSQGISTKTPDGFLIRQTVGQQSLTGTSSNKEYVVMQGFQQSMWGKYIASNNVDAIQGITTTTYPNPFTQTINFQFSRPVADMISISIFDFLGRLIFEKNTKSVNDILTIDLMGLPTSEYLIHLKTNSLNYYTKIIKK